MDDPNPNSGANSLAAKLYLENRLEYEKRVRQMVELSWKNLAENESLDDERLDAGSSSVATKKTSVPETDHAAANWAAAAARRNQSS